MILHLRVQEIWRINPLRFLWLLYIALRYACAWRTRFPVFRWYCVASATGGIVLYVINALRMRCCYDYAWRTYTLASLVGLALVVAEAIGWSYLLTPVRAARVLLSFLLTALTLPLIHHSPRWPQSSLELVFSAQTFGYMFLGVMLLPGRSLRCRILAAYLLLSAVLASGAARSIDRIGLAGDVLNVAAFAGLLLAE